MGKLVAFMLLLASACTGVVSEPEPPGKPGPYGPTSGHVSPVAGEPGAPSPPSMTATVVSLALANVGGTACGSNSLRGTSFETSCTGNGGQPEYWCSDFAAWVWENGGADATNLTAAAGSFYLYGQAHGTLSDTPALGDAVVFDYHGNGSADHVAIVTQIDEDGTIETVSGDWDGENGTEAHFSSTSSVVLNTPAYAPTVGSNPDTMAMTISRFIAPVPFTGMGDCAGLGDGQYCGGDNVPGAVNTLYQCTGGNLTVASVCANGCALEPGTINDRCN
jgi:hypothetical protein